MISGGADMAQERTAHEQWIRQTERGMAANAITVAHAPDFARHDRGAADDHWARAFGAPCARCGQLIEEGDFVRRRATDDWVHEQCLTAVNRPA